MRQLIFFRKLAYLWNLQGREFSDITMCFIFNHFITAIYRKYVLWNEIWQQISKKCVYKSTKNVLHNEKDIISYFSDLIFLLDSWPLWHIEMRKLLLWTFTRRWKSLFLPCTIFEKTIKKSGIGHGLSIVEEQKINSEDIPCIGKDNFSGAKIGHALTARKYLLLYSRRTFCWVQRINWGFKKARIVAFALTQKS